MLWASTGQTAAELISNRADPQLPNMGLTSWKGTRVLTEVTKPQREILTGLGIVLPGKT